MPLHTAPIPRGRPGYRPSTMPTGSDELQKTCEDPLVDAEERDYAIKVLEKRDKEKGKEKEKAMVIDG